MSDKFKCIRAHTNTNTNAHTVFVTSLLHACWTASLTRQNRPWLPLPSPPNQHRSLLQDIARVDRLSRWPHVSEHKGEVCALCNKGRSKIWCKKWMLLFTQFALRITLSICDYVACTVRSFSYLLLFSWCYSWYAFFCYVTF